MRRGTNQYWNENANTIKLLNGEPGYNVDTNQLKIGNGNSYWGDLPYINVAGPVGTYTTLSTATVINTAVTRGGSGSYNTFNIGSPIAQTSGQKIQFNPGAGVPNPPAPLFKNISYYCISPPSVPSSSIKVSQTLGGPNVILLATVSSKASTLISVTSADDGPLFTTALSVGQGVIFKELTSGYGIGLTVGSLYYLESLVVPYTVITGAIIRVSTSIGGTPI